MLVVTAADVVDPSATVPPNIVAEKKRTVVVIVRRRTRGFEMRWGSVRIAFTVSTFSGWEKRCPGDSKVCKLTSILAFEAAHR